MALLDKPFAKLDKLLSGDLTLIHENGIRGYEVQELTKFTKKVYNETHRDKITQEMIDAYKLNKKILEENNYGEVTFDFINYMERRNIPFNIENITPELIEEYKLYTKNIELLFEYGVSEFQITNKNINIHKEEIPNELIIEALERRIMQIEREINKIPDSPLFHNQKHAEERKITIMKKTNEIRRLERYIDKLYKNTNTTTNNPNSNDNTMFCRFCGAKIPEDSKFCKECGEKL